MPSLADQINDGPALFAALKALQRQFREFAMTQTATEQDRQMARCALSYITAYPYCAAMAPLLGLPSWIR